MNNSKSRFNLVLRFILFLLLFGITIPPLAAGQFQTRITIWTINQPGLDVTGDWMEEMISRFEAANPGIIVEHSYWENQSYK
ncbi:MAG: hypothetical protein ACM3YE_12715, partial [Bacteroidota bacterium]